MNLKLLNLLTGDDNQFTQGLVDLGWYDYAPVLTDYGFMGKARASLNPQFRAAGEVRGTEAFVYLSLAKTSCEQLISLAR